MYAYHYNTLLLQIWIVYQASCQKSGHLQVLPQLYVTLSSLQQDTWHLAARAGNKAWGGSSRHSVVLSPQHPLTASLAFTSLAWSLFLLFSSKAVSAPAVPSLSFLLNDAMYSHGFLLATKQQPGSLNTTSQSSLWTLNWIFLFFWRSAPENSGSCYNWATRNVK